MIKKYSTSFKMNVLRSLLLITFPLIGMLLVYNFYSYHEFNDKFIESNQQSLSLYAQNMHNDLNALDTFLFNVTVNDYNFRTLNSSVNSLQAHIASHEIMIQFKTALNSYQNVDAFFIYSTVNDVYRDIFASGYSYETKENIRQKLRDLTYTYDNYYQTGWISLEVNEKYYLFRLLGKDGTYAAVMVDFDHIQMNELVQKGTEVIYADKAGIPLTNKAFVAKQKLSLPSQVQDRYAIEKNDKYIAVGAPIQNSDLQLIFTVPKPSVFKGSFAVLFSLSLFTVALVLISLFFLNRSLLSPWQRLVNNIGKGSGQEQKEEYRIEEFKQVDAAFTQMSNEINQLKIVAYEHEIERQKAELQHLHLQIRPHFFLNCLKSLYGMAEQQSYKRIQHMILAISNHLRYNFKDNLQLVSLQQEVEHVQNYIHIQHIAHHIPPVCEISIDNALKGFTIPPLSIQAFVENCVKYATKPNEQLHIRIKAILLESDDGDYADITIQDNGEGFEPTILNELNCGDNTIYTDIHIGISNVRHRLSMLYGERAMLAFFNTQEGAVAEIILPINSRIKGGEENNERSDRG
ncbi:sensor histidine kinase [Paenibacillus sp. GXUN7292]|uniref:sensor histidine kinase n=1 Tax=Paenibacillus sp. GXUN7292 TaxID=3422499 RepID=UPI003D7C9B46